MATLAERRAEVVAAFVAQSVDAATVLGKRPPPYVAVIGEGIDTAHMIRGEALATFRLALIAGAWDDEAAIGQLDTLKHEALAVARALVGYSVGAMGRDVIRRIGASDQLAADLFVSAYVTI